MTLTEAMECRHTVRKFTDRALPAEVIQRLHDRMEAQNREQGLRMRLVTDSDGAFGPLLRLLFAKGARNYIVLAGEDTPDTEEALGYCGADLCLYAQTLGLNSWWVGATFSRKGAKRAAGVGADEKVYGVIAVGYGATQGSPHKSKAPEEVSRYGGEAPAWFQKGVRAALLAPTALNRQGFFITGEGNTAHIEYAAGALSRSDLGIVRYHFELGAGAEQFQWN